MRRRAVERWANAAAYADRAARTGVLRPHRHSGPVFGYLIEGEMVFELEGGPERVIRAGEAFSEPGGDVIHYQAANNRTDGWTRFVVVMIGVPGEPMLTLVEEAELEARRDRRAPRPATRAEA